jgi:hypothetical protein
MGGEGGGMRCRLERIVCVHSVWQPTRPMLQHSSRRSAHAHVPSVCLPDVLFAIPVRCPVGGAPFILALSGGSPVRANRNACRMSDATRSSAVGCGARLPAAVAHARPQADPRGLLTPSLRLLSAVTHGSSLLTLAAPRSVCGNTHAPALQTSHHHHRPPPPPPHLYSGEQLVRLRGAHADQVEQLEAQHTAALTEMRQR